MEHSSAVAITWKRSMSRQLQQAYYSMSWHIVLNKSTCPYIERHCFHVEPGNPTPLYRLCVSTKRHCYSNNNNVKAQKILLTKIHSKFTN